MSTESYSDHVFVRVIHSLFRKDNTPEEQKRSAQVITWLSHHQEPLEELFPFSQLQIIQRILTAFDPTTANTTTYERFKESLEQESPNTRAKILEILDIYDTDRDELPDPYNELDMPDVMRQAAKAALADALLDAMDTTKAVLASDGKDKEVAKLLKECGDNTNLAMLGRAEKALVFLRQRVIKMSSLTNLIKMDEHQDFQLVKDANVIRETYTKLKNEDITDERIPMGIPSYDNVYHPRVGQMFGILGYSGHRKSTLGRTWVYNALLQGRNVAHFALEMDYEMDMPFYYMIHCKNKYGIPGFDVELYKQGKLSEQCERLFHQDMDSRVMLSELKGELYYRQRGSMNWFDLCKEIEELKQNHGISMVFLDYLTLVSPGGRSNDRESINHMIQQTKPFVKEMGVMLVTPIQANREGFKACEEANGQWEPEGIDTYSSYHKACDSIIGVYSPKATPTRMVLSSVKIRTNSRPDTLGVEVCPETQFISERQR